MSKVMTLSALLLASAGSSLAAQMTIAEVPGSAADALFGATLAAAGDLDHDGFPDLLVGAPGDSPNGLPQAGRVIALSGRTRAVLGTHDGAADDAAHGAALAGGVDVNQDGWPDFLVGAPREGLGGAARLVSGKDFSTLYTWTGDSSFGSAVAFIGDVNLDGFVDLAVSDPTFGTIGAVVGRVRLFSGLTGSPLSIWVDAGPDGRFGSALAPVGDWNGDGRADLAVGVPGHSANTGRVEVRSGANGALLASHAGTTPGGLFGRCLARLGDVDGDGQGDLIASAYTAGDANGSATVLRWGTLTEWFTLIGPPAYGSSLASVGDVDRDGRDDFVAGAPFTGGGYAFVSSGATSGLLWTTLSQAGSDGFGSAVAGVGDVDGDGWFDLAVGAPDTDQAAIDAGHVGFWRAAVAQPSVGFGGPGDTLLEVYGMPLATGNTADLFASGAPLNAPAYLLLSTSAHLVGFRGGVIVPDLATAFTYTSSTDSTGALEIAGIPGGMGPGDVYLQLLTADPSLPQGVDFSNAVRCSFLP